MDVRHLCPTDGQMRELTLGAPLPTGERGCRCGVCERSVLISRKHLPAEGYGNPFDERGSIVLVAHVGRYSRRGEFFPLPGEDAYWEIIDGSEQIALTGGRQLLINR